MPKNFTDYFFQHFPKITHSFLFSYQVNNMVLEVMDSQLYLGLVFDSKLSWESEISNVCKNYTHLLNFRDMF